MTKKQIAKRFLISALALFFALLLVSLLIVFGFYFSGKMTADFTPAQLLLMSVAGAYIPTASYTGFCVCFINVNEFSKFAKFAIVFLFPLTLVFITLVGIIMVVPTIIKSIIILIKKEQI